MTILYKVESRRDFGNGKESVFPHKVVLCSVSSRNIIAFSALHSLSSHVYVCDVVTPWQYYKVCTSKSLINVLEWNASGQQLLLGYIGGRVEIWQPKDHALNVWHLQHHANIPSEDIIQAKFFHNGKGVIFNTQKKDHTYYAEKFERLEQRATLTGFGGVAAEGCILLTSSGLLAAFTLPHLQKLPPNSSNNSTGNSSHPEPPPLTTNSSCSEQFELTPATHSIGISRSYIDHCSIVATPSGALNIAYSVGWQQQQQLIHCFKVSLQLEGERIAIKSESLASIFLNATSAPVGSRRIKQLLWRRVLNEDVIYVVYGSADGGSLLEQWTLTRRHQNVHALLQQSGSSAAAGGKPVDFESWEQVAKLQLGAQIAHLCTTRLVTADCELLYAILQDNSVQVLEPGTLKQLTHTQFERDADARFVCADLTPTAQMLLIFDSHAQLHALQTPMLKQVGSGGGMMQLLLLLLEYCIVTGVDGSDVLLLNLGNLEALVEKLTDNFTRQPSYVRQFYYANFLALKSNLCRAQQQEFDNLIILHAISSTFKSLLRPSDLGCQDKGPADNLAMKLAESVPDVDTVMLNLDPKDFTVEPMMLQSLQQLIQWVTDLALNMLNRLPEEVMKCKLSGKRASYDISRDIVAIGSLRELLVMIRIWGLLNPQCLPVYTKTMDNIGVLVILFRLLTRLAQNTAEPDELLLDECSLLSKQLLIPQLSKYNPTTLLSAQGYAAVKSGQLTFTSLLEPVGLQDIEMEQVVFSNCVKDGVSNLQLGANPTTIRRCARCGFVNSANKVAKTSALKAWCNKWLHCHCGGFWKQIN